MMILCDLYIILFFYNYFSLLINTFTKRKRSRNSRNNQFIDIKFLLAQILGDFFRFPQISPDLYPPPNTNNLTLVKELPQIMILCDLYIIIWFYNYFSRLINTFTKRKRGRDTRNNQFIDIKFLLAQISGDFFRFHQISLDLYHPPNTNNLRLVKELLHHCQIIGIG